jgi:hypothetical protein
MSNNSIPSLDYFSISSIRSANCCSLYSRASKGVIGLIFSLRSLISCLYPLIVCEIICFFSSMLLSGACALSGMRSYTNFNHFYSLSVCSLSFSLSEVIWLQVICNILVTPLTTSKLAAGWTLYNSLVGISSMTTSTCSIVPMGFYKVS